MLAPTPVGEGAAKLLEALEKLGQSAGSGLRSEGPLAPPSDDLVRAFRDAMESPGRDASSGMAGGENAAQPGVDAVGQIPGMGGNTAVGRVAEDPESLAVNGVGGDGQVSPDAPDNSGGIGEREPGPAERMPPVEGEGEVSADMARTRPPEDIASDRTGQAEMEQNPLGEINRLVEQISRSGAAIAPTDLYRLQYLMGVFKMQSQTGQKVSQQMSQGLESVLRQQG